MKKILSIACLLLLVLSAKVNAQSNLTWIAKDKIEDKTFNSQLEFHILVEGLANQNEAIMLCNKIRTNQEVESCENLGKDEKGAYSINFKMKSPKEAIYYIGWAQKLGISYIVAKGEKKTPAEWARLERK
jgi:hypothetical protein